MGVFVLLDTQQYPTLPALSEQIQALKSMCKYSSFPAAMDDLGLPYAISIVPKFRPLERYWVLLGFAYISDETNILLRIASPYFDGWIRGYGSSSLAEYEVDDPFGSEHCWVSGPL